MKKITKVLCGILGAGLLLTGCATVSNIKNSDSELIYNGNAAVMVDKYLYYSNSIADVTDTTKFANNSTYDKQARISYLARLNTAVINATSKDYSPKSVESVTYEVTGQSTAFKFVLGDYVYYTAPKTEQVKNASGKLEYDFASSKIYRSKLNGDKKECLYTTSSAISKIETLKYNGKYYIILLEGTKLVKIEISGRVKVSTLEENAKSVALPKTYEKNKQQSVLDWNGDVYFTRTNDEGKTEVCRVAVASGDVVISWRSNSLTLIGREKDQIFYTENSKTYKYDSNTKASVQFFASAASEIYLIAADGFEEGYLLTANDVTTYIPKEGTPSSLTFNSNGSALSAKIIAINGRTIFLSTTTGIYQVSLSDALAGNDCLVLAEMTAINQTLYAYDGNYIYFYAQLENVEEDETITEKDANYYLYRTRTYNNARELYELISLTETGDRHSK